MKLKPATIHPHVHPRTAPHITLLRQSFNTPAAQYAIETIATDEGRKALDDTNIPLENAENTRYSLAT